MSRGPSSYRRSSAAWFDGKAPFSPPVRPSADGAPVRGRADLNGYHELGWTQDGFSFSAVSDLDETQLADFVSALRARWD